VPTGNNVVEFNIAGRVFEVPWLAGETADTFKATALAAINSRSDILPVSSVSGGVGIITMNARGLGRWGNDVRVRARLLLTATGTEAVTNTTFTNLAGGTTDPDLTTLNSLVNSEEYHYIALGLSNTDVVLATSGSNVSRVQTMIANGNTGAGARLRQYVTASTTTLSAAKAAAIFRNAQFGQHLLAENMLSLPGELVAREVGGRLAMTAVDPAGNRIGEVLDGLFPSADLVADRPTQTEIEDALTNGVSIVSYTSNGDAFVTRPITMYSVDSAGGPDRRLLDVQNVDSTYIVARSVRTNLQQTYPNAKVIRDIVPGDDPPPKNVIEERDIKATIVSHLRSFQRDGVVQGAALDEAVEKGTLIVRVNDTDPTQVDTVIPISIVQPLAKLGVVVNRVPG
jgi:phage tail sheath gpL-like